MEDRLSVYYSNQLFQQEVAVLTLWPAWGGPF